MIKLSLLIFFTLSFIAGAYWGWHKNLGIYEFYGVSRTSSSSGSVPVSYAFSCRCSGAAGSANWTGNNVACNGVSSQGRPGAMVVSPYDFPPVPNRVCCKNTPNVNGKAIIPAGVCP
jgi:hypothetical protein